MFKRFFYQRVLVSNYIVIIFLPLLSAGCVQSDKQFLRPEFSLPSSVKLVSFNSSPDMRLLPREGLSITATFKFTPTEFAIYREKAKRDDRWKPLPVSREFVIKITGIRSIIKSVNNSYKIRGEAIPTLGSIYNPTEEQAYEEWVKRLPLDVQNGLYQCQTSGSDIMHDPKVPCSLKSGDLRDFMFAVLDFEHQTLRVRVNTLY